MQTAGTAAVLDASWTGQSLWVHCNFSDSLLPNFSGLFFLCHSQGGSSVVRFSPCGWLLAVASIVSASAGPHIVQIFESCSGALLAVLASHQSIIYSIDFHRITTTEPRPSDTDYDYAIATASSDCTVKLWHLPMSLWLSPTPASPPLIDTPVLTHGLTSFAYQAAFHPLPHASNTGTSLLAVACYSGHISLFHSDCADAIDSLDEHYQDSTAVLSLCWSALGDTLFSCDSRGAIRVWQDRLIARTLPAGWTPQQPNAYRSRFNCTRVIDCFRDVPSLGPAPLAATQVLHCPQPARLCVMLQNGRVIVWNSATWRLHQIVDSSTRGRCCLSPDGHWLAIGAASGHVQFISLLNSESSTKNIPTPFPSAPTDLAWHPTEHSVAVCLQAEQQPVVVLETTPAPAPVSVHESAIAVAARVR